MKLAFDTELEGLREEFRKPLASVTLRSTLDWLQTGATMDKRSGRAWESSAGSLRPSVLKRAAAESAS